MWRKAAELRDGTPKSSRDRALGENDRKWSGAELNRRHMDFQSYLRAAFDDLEHFPQVVAALLGQPNVAVQGLTVQPFRLGDGLGPLGKGSG